MERNLVKHGFVLILLSLLTGFVIPIAEAPRLALSAHTIGLISGILLLTLSAVWKYLVLSERQEKVAYWGWLYSSYAIERIRGSIRSFLQEGQRHAGH